MIGAVGIAVNIHVINPIADNRWEELVARHPRASVFHRRGWLEALARTYGYQPRVLTTSPPGAQLSDGIVFCLVSSWITGTRLVSLPFSDHCEPLLDDVGQSAAFVSWLESECERKRWKYAELRPRLQDGRYGQPSRSYCFHELDLTPTLQQIFRKLHKDSIQRSIRRAEREQLSCDTGRSEKLLDDFYRLLLLTRRRHCLPPQPRTWFENLLQFMGDDVQIRVARKNGNAIAAMLTLRHRWCVTYKYGCSDEKLHKLGGMPFLFWRLIEESKDSGADHIDFGRSDLDNEGLITFKDRFGTEKRMLTYYRYPRLQAKVPVRNWDSPAMHRLISILPDAVLSVAGRIFYRHMG
jgi:hypothetical protein